MSWQWCGGGPKLDLTFGIFVPRRPDGRKASSPGYLQENRVFRAEVRVRWGSASG